MKFKSAKVINILEMPENVREAYDMVVENYSDKPAKGNCKELYHHELSSLGAYSDGIRIGYPIIYKWLLGNGVDMDKEEMVLIEWEW